MTTLQALILGLIQGVTEFLPISSSGHLVLAEQLLGVPPSNDVTFEVFVHFGTLLSVVVVFWHDIFAIVKSVHQGASKPLEVLTHYRNDPYFKISLLILLGSIPAAYIGIRYENQISTAFSDPKLVAVMLVLTGLVLFLTRLAPTTNGKELGVVTAFLVGCAQAMAIIPGISRSGSTISTAMFLRISPMEGARFSFLLSVPVIAGATLMKTKDLITLGSQSEGALPIVIGTVAAFAAGYVSIKVLLKIIQRGKFSLFSFYCLIVGTIGIIFLD